MSTFSIIIPTYNSEATLKILLESIHNQSYTDYEVIVVDGDSTDATLEIIQKFDSNIPQLVVISEKDRGIYDAMNKGIDLAKGKWLIFMGSDDTFYNHRVLEKVSEKIEKTSAKVIYGDAFIVGDTGWAKDGAVYDGDFDVDKLLRQNICHQAMFYNTQFVKEKIGYFNLNYTKSSDWDFNLRCWALQPFEYVNLIISNFAAGGMSTLSTDHTLISDFVANLQSYFGWSLFDSSLTTPGTWFYPMVLKKQKERHAFRFKVINFKNKLKKKFKRLLK